MKRMTFRELRLDGRPIISAGQCYLQHILCPFERSGYSCGKHGYNFGVYMFSDFIITVGYRKQIGKFADEKACAAIDDAYFDWCVANQKATYAQQAEKAQQMLSIFAKQILSA